MTNKQVDDMTIRWRNSRPDFPEDDVWALVAALKKANDEIEYLRMKLYAAAGSIENAVDAIFKDGWK